MTNWIFKTVVFPLMMALGLAGFIVGLALDSDIDHAVGMAGPIGVFMFIFGFLGFAHVVSK